MQAVISLPGLGELEGMGGIRRALFRRVCGIPLLVRVIVTASKSGASSVLLLRPPDLPEAWLRAGLNSSLLSSVPIQIFPLDRPFDPLHRAAWLEVEGLLEPRFLWLPWNFVADSRVLGRMIQAGASSSSGVRFVWSGVPSSPEMASVLVTEALTASPTGLDLADCPLEVIPVREASYCPVNSEAAVRRVERELVRRSGKEWDGIYSNFNRRLCRPFVRWLSKTPVTPNMVTWAGLPLAFLSGAFFAQGYWSASVVGALLYFAAVLFDEIDGMLARVTFQESAFGCWLETMVDYASYLPVFAGMAIGLHRQYGRPWLAMGGLLLFGTLATFLVVIRQRKLATSPDNPSQYLPRYYRKLEEDSGNIVSRFVRQVQFLIKKGVLCHHLLLFSLLGGLEVFFALAVLGANLAWTLALYTNRLFRPSQAAWTAGGGKSILLARPQSAKGEIV